MRLWHHWLGEAGVSSSNVNFPFERARRTFRRSRMSEKQISHLRATHKVCFYNWQYASCPVIWFDWEKKRFLYPIKRPKCWEYNLLSAPSGYNKRSSGGSCLEQLSVGNQRTTHWITVPEFFRTHIYPNKPNRDSSFLTSANDFDNIFFNDCNYYFSATTDLISICKVSSFGFFGRLFDFISLEFLLCVAIVIDRECQKSPNSEKIVPWNSCISKNTCLI